MVISRDRLFYPTLTRIMDFCLAHHCFLFENKFPEVPVYAEMQFHMMTSLKHNIDVT